MNIKKMLLSLLINDNSHIHAEADAVYEKIRHNFPPIIWGVAGSNEPMRTALRINEDIATYFYIAAHDGTLQKDMDMLISKYRTEKVLRIAVMQLASHDVELSKDCDKILRINKLEESVLRKLANMEAKVNTYRNGGSKEKYNNRVREFCHFINFCDKYYQDLIGGKR